MKPEKIRSFEYEKSQFPKCRLRTSCCKTCQCSTTLKIEIKKLKKVPVRTILPPLERGTIRFRTWNMDIREGNGYIDCQPGHIKYIRVDPELQGCGIGTILIKLCMNEKKIHNVKMNRKNIALKSLKILKFKKTMNWIKSHCSKVVMLKMKYETHFLASMLFKSAKQFGFSILVIKRQESREPPTLYPKAGPCNIHELATNYKNRKMDIDGSSVPVVGDNMEWYFCRPTKKTAKNIPKCKNPKS